MSSNVHSRTYSYPDLPSPQLHRADSIGKDTDAEEAKKREEEKSRRLEKPNTCKACVISGGSKRKHNRKQSKRKQTKSKRKQSKRKQSKRKQTKSNRKQSKRKRKQTKSKRK